MIYTKLDFLINTLKDKKVMAFEDVLKELEVSKEYLSHYLGNLEDLGLVRSKYTPKHFIEFVNDPDSEFRFDNEKEVLNEMKILLEYNDLKKANKFIYDLYYLVQKTQDDSLKEIYSRVSKFYKNYLEKVGITELNQNEESVKTNQFIEELEKYALKANKFFISTKIVKQEFEPVPYYLISLIEFGPTTRAIIKHIKEEVIKKISLNSILENKNISNDIKKEFYALLFSKLKFLLEGFEDDFVVSLSHYYTELFLGMGEIELLLLDENIEEIVINSANEPIWVYHKKHSWLRTNVIVEDEETIKHYASLAGRIVNRDITLLNPLLDAHLKTGDRMNATLQPISSGGNTITIRKFASNPWTITSFIKNKTIDFETAAWIWTALQYELSVLIVGGTGSGKTSILNVVSNFFSPKQRIITIEDTRELILPETLHWVPLETRLPNPEGQGEVSMLDLVVNSLRMRPDRILVGEIRRKREAEVLFEAMHTGHSVYATLHANSVEEAVQRLTNPPIDLPKSMLNSLSLLVVQNRNRRTGKRRTFQVAEISSEGDANLLFELDVAKDQMKKVNAPERLFKNLSLFGGLTEVEVMREIDEKMSILKYLIDNDIDDVNRIGNIISDYYLNKDFLFKRLFSKEINVDPYSSTGNKAEPSNVKEDIQPDLSAQTSNIIENQARISIIEPIEASSAENVEASEMVENNSGNIDKLKIKEGPKIEALHPQPINTEYSEKPVLETQSVETSNPNSLTESGDVQDETQISNVTEQSYSKNDNTVKVESADSIAQSISSSIDKYYKKYSKEASTDKDDDPDKKVI